MTLPVADQGINACVAALQRAGLELREPGEEGAGAEFLLHGNTYANKELLKRHGGRWSSSRQAWVFESLEPIRDLATALPANGEPQTGGLADAPAAYGVDRSTRRFRRKHYHGHRERLRTRFLEAGPQSLPDYELLELLLFHSIDVKDTKPLAKRLLARFGSLGGVISADPRLFAEFDELRENTGEFAQYHAFRSSAAYQLARDAAPEARSEEARRWLAYEESGAGRREIDLYWARRHTEILLKAIGEVLKRALREEIKDRPVIGSWSALIDYLQVALAHEPIEQFRVLFLDRKNILIRDELQQRGTVDHTPLYPREIVKRALELGASSIIMVHNHPSGDPTPSRADIEMTKQVVQAMSAVGLTVHDHVIVGKNRHTSFKSQRLI
ncbi:MAG TPA: JAB domain-containing protein [Geminicoccaceae bacterium]|jgi:DNA repair protein RadC|nr:JAB domain-containing protein [Geminicoccaceae bacterium]